MKKRQPYFKSTAKALSSVSAVAMLMASGGAMAQSNDDEGVVEEVIVTAGRREQVLQDVPASVTAISPDDFKFKGQTRVQDILGYTPGITFTSGTSPGSGTLSARGVPQSSATPVFGIYLDDTPLTSNTNFSNGARVLLDGLLFDIERVEIIKGPQGTLFGATSVGGLMRYITRDPSTDEWRATASVDAGQISQGGISKTFSGRVSIPVAKDRLGVTVAGYYKDNAGYVDQVDGTGALIKEDANDSEVEGYSVDVLFKPSDKLDIRLKYLGQKNAYTLGSTVDLASGDSTDGLFIDYGTTAAPGPNSLDYNIYSGTIDYEFGGFDLTSTTSTTDYKIRNEADLTTAFAGLVDILGGRTPGTTTHVGFVGTSGAKKTVHETRLTSNNSDKFEWIGGFFYTKEDTHNVQDAPVVPDFDLIHASFPSVYKEFAGFANGTLYVNDKLSFSAGARISKNEISLDFNSSGVLVGVTNFESDLIEDTVETYLLTASYKVNENNTLYSRIASGYRPAQGNLPIIDPFTQENIAPPIVFADKAWSYEAGVKGNSDDSKVGYELSIWKIDWANFQAPVAIFGVTTGGNAEHGLSAYGFESSFTMNPSSDFSLIANLSYTNSTLNDDEPTLSGAKDELIPNLPKWKGSLQFNYNFIVGGDWSGNFGGGFRYMGSTMSAYAGNPNTAAREVGARTFGDLNLGFTNGNVNIGLYATNLFNNRSLLSRSDAQFNGTVVQSTGAFERPRTIGINLRYSY